MQIEVALAERIAQLVNVAKRLSLGDRNGKCTDPAQTQECVGWIAAAQNVAQILCPDERASYRVQIDRIADQDHGYVANHAVGSIAAILRHLARDAEDGLVASMTDRVRAEIFDDFLDHAGHYLEADRKDPAAVIAGVVFEDTVRKIALKIGIEEAGVDLERLINALKQKGLLSGVQAKRSKVAAGVRTNATHAQWNEITASDVREVITFVKELVAKHLDG